MINRFISFSQRYKSIVRNIDFENIPMKGHFEQMFQKTKPTQLGRWGLVDDSKVNSRIDWSNEDHCGPCGSLKLEKKNNFIKK